MIKKLRDRIKELRRSIWTLQLAAADPRVGYIPKILIVIAVAYALSPIDLIPDFIPVIGLLDDLVILPVLIWLAIRSIPKVIFEEYQLKASRLQLKNKKKNWIVGTIIITFWVSLMFWIISIYS